MIPLQSFIKKEVWSVEMYLWLFLPVFYKGSIVHSHLTVLCTVAHRSTSVEMTPINYMSSTS